MNTSLFPDVNVWLALAHKVHPHHSAAIAWGTSQGRQSRFLFCRFTQLSVLRLLTNASMMKLDVASQAEAWSIYDRFFENGATYLVEEPRGIELLFRSLTSRSTTSTKEWADSYLSAFAAAAGYHLVTFDRALARRTAGSVWLTA